MLIKTFLPKALAFVVCAAVAIPCLPVELRADETTALKKDLQNENSDSPTPTELIERRYERFKEMSIEELQREVGQKHWEAAYILGRRYEEGDGLEANPQKAFALYLSGSQHGDPLCLHALGWCYDSGIGVAQNNKAAANCYRSAAEQGLAKSQSNLGICYLQATGVSRDKKRAVHWTLKAAEQGYAPAQANLGFMYEHGSGVPSDNEKAVNWYRLAASKGNACGQNNLGHMYVTGKGVKKDFSKAYELFRKSAEQGFAHGQNYLGVCYVEGWGVSLDRREAIKWFKLAAKQGIQQAKDNLRKQERFLAELNALATKNDPFAYNGWPGGLKRPPATGGQHRQSAEQYRRAAERKAAEDAQRFMRDYRRNMGGGFQPW